MAENREINILYTFDNKFWQMAAVAIASVIRAKNPDTKITVYCMVAPHTHGRRKIRKIIEKSGGRLVWRVIRVDENPFKDFAFLRWSPVIFYRLFACDIFPDVEKMLYMDSDTLVMADLCELYNTDVSNYALGAVRDIAPTNDILNPSGSYVAWFMKEFLKHNLYINSGVLLLNLPKMHEYMDKMLGVSVPLRYPDQEVINVALDGKIKSLPLKYNFVPNTQISRNFSKEEYMDAQLKPVILHYYATKPYVRVPETPEFLYNIYDSVARSIGFSCDYFYRIEDRRHMGVFIRFKAGFQRVYFHIYKIYAALRMIIVVLWRTIFKKKRKHS